MATIDTKEIIDAIIAANGKQYDDEPAVSRIVEYTNQAGVRAWGVVWEHEVNQFRYDYPTQFIGEPNVIFERK